MIHCVTQQQPGSQNPIGIIEQGNSGIRLSQNSPNPFSDSTVIPFTLEKGSFVTLEVFDSQGKKVTTIINFKFAKGEHSYTLLADDYKSGIYSYTLTIDEIVISCKKMVVVK